MAEARSRRFEDVRPFNVLALTSFFALLIWLHSIGPLDIEFKAMPSPGDESAWKGQRLDAELYVLLLAVLYKSKGLVTVILGIIPGFGLGTFYGTSRHRYPDFHRNVNGGGVRGYAKSAAMTSGPAGTFVLSAASQFEINRSISAVRIIEDAGP